MARNNSLTPQTHSIIFFGSFQNYSVDVLAKLSKSFEIQAVITTPPAPKGRHLKLAPTEVAVYAKEHKLPLLELLDLTEIPIKTIPDFIVVAGYGKLIPSNWLTFPKIMAINLHPSLLPYYRGRFPAEWAILNSETETGVTLLKMSPEFDKGEILAQEHLPIFPTDTKHTLYQKLFALGADLLVNTLPNIAEGRVTPQTQAPGKYFYARGLSREDGYISWSEFESQIKSEDSSLKNKLRALLPWPGVWTLDPKGRRIKLLGLNPTLTQIESQKPKKSLPLNL